MEACRKLIAERTEPLTGPLSFELEIICNRPKKKSGHAPMGDWDNFGKGTSDLCQFKRCFEDDRQICKAVVIKRYVRANEKPRMTAIIRELPESEEYCA